MTGLPERKAPADVIADAIAALFFTPEQLTPTGMGEAAVKALDEAGYALVRAPNRCAHCGTRAVGKHPDCDAYWCTACRRWS